MTRSAWIGNLVLVRHRRRDELKSVSVNKSCRWTFRFNRWHVARDAVVAGAAGRVMGVLLNRDDVVRSVGRARVVAGEAQIPGRFDRVGVVRRPVDLMTAEAGHTAPIHHAFDEIVALHPVLVPGAVCKVHEVGLAEFVFLELPVIAQIATLVKPDRPIVVLRQDRIRERLSLRMALNAGIVRPGEVQPRWIDDVGGERLAHVLTAWAMAALATDVPLSDLFGLDVVVH